MRNRDWDKTGCPSGFTLIELMVTLAVLIILAGFSIPAVMKTLPNQHLKTAANNLRLDMHRARLEAIKRDAPVVFSFDIANNQYELFVDNGAGTGTAGDFSRDGSEELLKQVTLKSATLKSAVFSGGTTAAGYTARGLPINNRVGNVVLEGSNGQRQYRLVFSAAGYIRMDKSDDSGVSWE